MFVHHLWCKMNNSRSQELKHSSQCQISQNRSVFSQYEFRESFCQNATQKETDTDLSTTSMSKQKRLSMESVFLRMQDLSWNISGWLRTTPFWNDHTRTQSTGWLRWKAVQRRPVFRCLDVTFHVSHSNGGSLRSNLQWTILGLKMDSFSPQSRFN